MAAFVLLSLAFAPAATQAAGISILDERCVSGDGVVEVQFPSDIESFELNGPDTDTQNTTANFKTFSGLSDGDYTLTAYTTSGGSTITFSVDCDPATPAPKPEVSLIDQRCVSNDGVVEVSFTNVVRFELTGPNTDSQNTTANFKTFSGLDDGNYTLTVWNADGATDTLTFTVDCDPATLAPAPTLTGSCFANPSNVKTGDTVQWGVSGVSGGTGSYSYSWSGAVSGSGANHSTVHNTTGTYTATLTVTSGSQTVTDTCSVGVTAPATPTPGPGLSGSCSVSDNSVGLSDDVTFTANASGGSSPYSYSWNLEGSNDDDDTKSVTTEYKQTGTYDATVTISDNSGNQINRTCSVTVNTNDNDDDGGGGDRLKPRGKDRVRGDRDVNFAVQCLPSKSIYGIGEVVLFEATIDNNDVDIDDVNFDWSGASNIRETGDSATVRFSTSGVKEIRVSARYDGDTETDTCYVQIGRGVSLGDVPYTGPGDVAKTLGFITTILLLALAGGYAIIKRREDDGIPVGIPTDHK